MNNRRRVSLCQDISIFGKNIEVWLFVFDLALQYQYLFTNRILTHPAADPRFPNRSCPAVPEFLSSPRLTTSVAILFFQPTESLLLLSSLPLIFFFCSLQLFNTSALTRKSSLVYSNGYSLRKIVR